jgi:3-isopropylmalate dehydrogenase
MDFHIATIPGDGIGPDVVAEATQTLETLGKRCGHKFSFEPTLMGGCAIDATGEPLPKKTLETCLKADSVLLGAVGGPKWDSLPGNQRPEKGLLGIRAGMKVFANLRPAVLFPQLAEASPLKPEIVGSSFDLLIVRELTGGIYFGERGRSADGQEAWDTEKYSVMEIERLLRVGFEAALKRGKKVTVVDKANILESSRLWREVTQRVAKDYPAVAVDFLYVDNCSMQLVKNPRQFDVIVTSNMFGDILSDEASMITGSIGMLASASLGEGKNGLYEPIHGSAPDIAGKDLANPIATILSAAMMMKYSFGLEEESKLIESAVGSVLSAGYRTGDIYSEGRKKVGTREMGKLIREALAK